MDFKNFLQQKKMLPKTIARQQKEVNTFLNWLNNDPLFATKKDLLNYLAYSKENRNLSNATQSNILAILKNYFTYLAQQHHIPNITNFIKIRGTNRKHLPTLLTTNEVDILCEAYFYHIQNYQPTAKEIYFYPNYTALLQGYYIALTLIAYQAVQVHELLAITNQHFNLQKGTITIEQSNKAAGRTLPLQAAQIAIILQYFTTHTTLLPNKNHLEKLTHSLKKLYPKYKNLQQLRISKISHWLSIYGLRKTQYLAGHKHISSTEKYQPTQIQTLQQNIKDYHPLQ